MYIRYINYRNKFAFIFMIHFKWIKEKLNLHTCLEKRICDAYRVWGWMVEWSQKIKHFINSHDKIFLLRHIIYMYT